ncbi:MAG: hypothetical protein QOK44_1048, partial [Betaproteobacteria bacterium]|nr:hypothetical protein [Betaproteobacteria bacterium]
MHSRCESLSPADEQLLLLLLGEITLDVSHSGSDSGDRCFQLLGCNPEFLAPVAQLPVVLDSDPIQFSHAAFVHLRPFRIQEYKCTASVRCLYYPSPAARVPALSRRTQLQLVLWRSLEKPAAAQLPDFAANPEPSIHQQARAPHC